MSIRKQLARHSRRERSSRTFLKAPHLRFIFGNPRGDLCMGKLARRWQLGARDAKARSKEQDKFLLLLGRKRVGSGFDFIECRHKSQPIQSCSLADSDNKKMVGATGFEPAAPCSQSRCATGLRYAPTVDLHTLPYVCARSETGAGRPFRATDSALKSPNRQYITSVPPISSIRTPNASYDPAARRGTSTC